MGHKNKHEVALMNHHDSMLIWDKSSAYLPTMHPSQGAWRIRQEGGRGGAGEGDRKQNEWSIQLMGNYPFRPTKFMVNNSSTCDSHSKIGTLRASGFRCRERPPSAFKPISTSKWWPNQNGAKTPDDYDEEGPRPNAAARSEFTASLEGGIFNYLSKEQWCRARWDRKGWIGIGTIG